MIFVSFQSMFQFVLVLLISSFLVSSDCGIFVTVINSVDLVSSLWGSF
jgi:hypothetical protein